MSLKCHSAFVHYNMFHDRHCHGGGNIIGSVFNITNNCSGNHGGFLGGLGAGLGWGLGNFLGGLTGMFSNFGFGGFGFGFPGLFGGFGFPGLFGGWSNLWGGNSTITNDYSRYSSDKSECKCGCKGNGDKKDKLDIDNPKFATISEKISNLEAGKVTQEVYNQIKSELDAALEGTDGIQTTDDQKTYRSLLKILDELKNADVVEAPPVTDAEGENKIKIGNKVYDIDNITIENIKDWTASDISGLTPEKAKSVLVKLGYVDNNVGKMSTNYKVLLLLQKSGVNVQCANNPGSQDKMIQGKISNVAETNGKLSYTIDNGTADGIFEYKYTFQQVDDKNGKKCFHLTKLEKNDSQVDGYVEKEWKNKDYIFQEEMQPLQTSGKPLVSKYNRDERIKLETELQ